MKKTIANIAGTLLLAGVLITLPSCTQRPAVDPKIVKFNQDADNLISGLQQYKQFVGEYPPGDNVQVVQALLGQTKDKKVLIVALSRNDLNAKGEILDPWGTPLQFFFSKNGVLVRSAGPNKLWEDSANPRCDDLFRTELPPKPNPGATPAQ